MCIYNLVKDLRWNLLVKIVKGFRSLNILQNSFIADY